MKHWNAFVTVQWFANGSRRINTLRGYTVYDWFLRTAYGRH